MKYRVIAIFSCLFMLGAILGLSLLPETRSARFHQHRDAPEKEPCSFPHSEETLCSHLPLLILDTNGVVIPGRPVVGPDQKLMYYTKAEDGRKSIDATLEVIDHEREYNHPEDEAELTSAVRIHIRGRSSRYFDKPNYSLRLVKENGKNRPLPLLGMPAHHEWILHGPFLDKTLLQNYMWYNLAGELMDYAPQVRFCELLLNGHYEGVYVLTERITAGKNCRLTLDVRKKTNFFSGYLLRLDRGKQDEMQDISTFTDYTGRMETQLNIEYPGKGNLTPEIRDSISRDFSRFEKALYSFDYRDPQYGWPALVDADSFVNYFLINELCCNYDAGSLSTYIYKEPGQKYRLCVWDFNNACDHYQQNSMVEPQRFELHRKLWFEMLCRDSHFTEQIIRQYRALRKSIFSNAFLEQYIDDVVTFLGPAIERDYARWGYAYSPSHDLLKPAERNPRSYEEAVYGVKTFLRSRTAWMDTHIECLRQYSADSAVKRFKTVTE